jgi:AraC-like DNA-binding protein
MCQDPLVPYRELVPHRALRPFVDRLWADDAVGAEPRRVLPDGCIDLLISEGRAFVVGAMTRPLLLEAGPPARVVAARFRPGGAACFLREDAGAVTDRQVEAEALGLAWAGALAERDPTVRALEQALLERLPAPPEPLVAHAVSQLFGAAPPSVDQLARRIGWSRQHLSRAFRAHVGLSPKQLGRVARFQRALARLQRGTPAMAQEAADLGYFDQAHMNRDFRALAGLTPGTAAAGSIFPIRSLLDEPWIGP